MTVVADKEQVEHQMDDWVARLEGLYQMVEEFASRLSDGKPCRVFRGSILQPEEPEIERSGATPRMWPTLAVLHGRSRMLLTPRAFWLPGANGRLSVATNRRTYALADLGELMVRQASGALSPRGSHQGRTDHSISRRFDFSRRGENSATTFPNGHDGDRAHPPQLGAD